MELEGLTDRDYLVIRDLLFRESGISLGAGKKPLVSGRLFKRIQSLGLASYGDYFAKLASGMEPDEMQIAVDLLTTNETYFFREPRHFEILSGIAASAVKGQEFRVWSAACSTGEEVYTIAMTLQELSRKGRCPTWGVRGSDLSSRVLEKATAGMYGMERTEGISDELMRRYFLRGTGPYEGKILVEHALREKTEFAQINLIEPLPKLVPFDVIFLRNVLIYFEAAEKRKIVRQLLAALVPDGVLFVGLAESLHGLIDGLVQFAPGAYRADRRR